ncbi:Serine peptidase (modular protein) [Rhodococcus sp. RD6.2]|jgi:membrane associated rhomboid family serine protease|uniref:rhomboid family intramembrane serine protease n=1 Tax=Rhodococcus sp. RD6.2 TaxID=260936 RepID=UPI00063B4584|nr:rhomboid family intramembrane serine protease [Rhodococcus sp. RD6.2]CRK53861.1 Serine peptidase (modular protein) [Rhodococcus sp. RD6.2]
MTNPGWGGGPGEGIPPQPRCVRHPDRPTGLSCTRCGRPACPECLRPASVGQHCVDCVAEDNRRTAQVRTVAGAPVRSGLPTPVVTYVLMAINVVVFLVTALQAQSVMDNGRGFVNPFTGAAVFDSELFGRWVLSPLDVANGDWMRILGSGFLHFGLLHLAVNMFALYILGRDTELVFGRSRYLCVYLISLLGGSASVMAFENGGFTAGASGAIFGIMGAQAVILLKLRRSPAPVVGVIAINVIISVTVPGISIFGHLGGLVAGAAAAAALLYAPQWLGAGQDREKAIRIGWIGLAVVALVTVGLIGLRAAQLRSEFGL